MSQSGSGCKDCKRVKEHVALLLPFTVLEAMLDKPLRIRGVTMCSGMSRNLNVYTSEELQNFSSKLANAPVYIEHVAVPNAVGKVTKTDWDGHKYSPFAERAGMQKIAEQKSVESVSNISEVLKELGFDLLLGSARYVRAKLQTLDLRQVVKLKKVFAKNNHPRLKKEFAASRHQPFGETIEYIENLRSADNQKIAKLIKVTGLLLQTKVYLFGKKGNNFSLLNNL